MADRAIRILGVDTSLRSTGVGVIQAEGSRMRAVEYGRIHNPAALPHSECLLRLSRGISEILARTQPEAVSIEGIFHCQNVKVAVILGEARGAVIAACASAGVPVHEYAPRRVKQSVVGHGAASKDQVQRMIQAVLGLDALPQEDAADALALAICHLHQRTHLAALQPKPL